MFTKTALNTDKSVTCGACGGKGHINDKYWNIIRYPKWHYKYKQPRGSVSSNQKGNSPTGNWHNSRQNSRGLVAANVVVDATASGQPIVFSPQQLQQLLQLIPTHAQSVSSDSVDDVLDSPFSDMIVYDNVQAVQTICDDWIVDTGDTNHI